MSNSNALLSNPLALYDILQKAYTEMFFPIFFSFSIPFYLFNVSIHNLFAHSLINEYINDKKISYKRYWNCRVFVDLYINYDTAWSNNASFSYLSGGFYPPFMLDEHENCSNIKNDVCMIYQHYPILLLTSPRHSQFLCPHLGT